MVNTSLSKLVLTNYAFCMDNMVEDLDKVHCNLVSITINKQLEDGICIMHKHFLDMSMTMIVINGKNKKKHTQFPCLIWIGFLKCQGFAVSLAGKNSNIKRRAVYYIYI